jgi:AcrR family transcriptional regulator
MAHVDARKQLGSSRPRNPERERALLLSAAMKVMRRNGFAHASVADILEEAGLSTRAFYRHFESKDDLVGALYRADAEHAAARLDERVAAAPTPEAKLEAWIDEILSFAYDPRRAPRVSVMSSEAARRSVAEREQRAAQALLTAPLLRVLEAGQRDGSFPSADPVNDAHTIHRLVFGLVMDSIAGRPRLDRDTAQAHALRFCRAALLDDGREREPGGR